MINKTRQPIGHLLIFFLSLGLLIFIFYFTQAQTSRVSQIKAEINYLEESQSRLNELNSLLPKYSQEKDKFLSTLPNNEKEIALYASSLEKLAKANDLVISLSLDDFQSPVDVSGHYISGVGIEITLEGGTLNMSNFLQDVSQQKYYTKIDKMTLIRLDGKLGAKAVVNGYLMVNLAI